ncbi:MAG: DEAD/DEAH box helicase [Chloracidobacterium sp.]|nr:DEAD/DEAH box helicase [Chloracidobacterium sp.]
MSFQALLDKYRKFSFSERDKGERFERLMQAYLQTDPKYAYRFKHVWLWSEFPYRKDFGGNDTGIDLVSQTHEGDFWAIQCKFYQEGAIIDKPAVDSFLSTSGRMFRNEQMQTVGFAYRLWIDTTGHKFGANAEEAIHNQVPQVTRLNLYELREAPVDWDKLEQGIHGELARTAKKSLFHHQQDALEKAHEHYKKSERGKLIMACGTGKTFTSLRIAEHETKGTGTILFLVPSIALLGQALREWSADAAEPIHPICICSDPDVSKQKKKQEDIDAFSVVDLALPASTDPKVILAQFEIAKRNKTGMTVVFSTYQSIEVIAAAQKVLLKNGFPEFDMIICDEAHRTTGVTLSGEDEKHFVKVHNENFIRAKKRMYMTATPRLYSEDSKSKAKDKDAVLASMDDPKLYGEEIYRIGFGEAVEKGLLTDYKVLILTLSDKDLPTAVQNALSQESEIKMNNDISLLVGCVNALSKQFIGDDGETKKVDPEPMRRAVAFTSSIKASNKIASMFNKANESYLTSLPQEKKEQMVTVEARHMDGTMSAPTRDEMLSWVKSPTDGNECRVLTNVRVLSEGVDVPSLDAVMFLSAKNSQVDVVQSVGRVMRKAPGKNYGYIIIPVVVPADIEPNKALDDNKRFSVVWTVLNALRAHDDRFNATVNKIDINKMRPDNISVVGISDGDRNHGSDDIGMKEADYQAASDSLYKQMAMQFEQLQSFIFARMVQKVGDRRYWEQWAKDVAQIAERQTKRIQDLISSHEEQKDAFARFVDGLRKNINPSITESQAVDMLAQHIITKPVFEALFEGYSFVKHNAVSQAMQSMLDALQEETLPEDSEKLQRFYESVKSRAAGIDNADGKQRIIIELYDKFFKTAFPKMVEQLGIVYTPIEPVDFIIHSIEHILQTEFGRRLSDENVHILDPFTGTGTFVTRLIQSGLIKPQDLERKYKHELHANEIVLLAYYIAAVNIENAYHDQTATPDDGIGKAEYHSFDGIVLTDTFQLGETGAVGAFDSVMFTRNSERVVRQKKAPLRVIMGNPPYSVGQRSANDNAQNQKYEFLDSRIANTYAKATDATNKNSLYDSYIKAFRWSTDRLDPEHGGVIAFISNGGWLDGNSGDGFRKTLEKEFTGIWIFNLRGNARTSGELRQKEAGNVFGGGTRTPVTITLLVKNPAVKTGKAIIHYHDIGDYLDHDQKLALIKQYASIASPEMQWTVLQPDEHGDWLSLRNDVFDTFIALGDKDNKQNKVTYFVPFYSNGVKTQRDAWCYNSSKKKLKRNVQIHLDFYNDQRLAYIKASKSKTVDVKSFLNRDPKSISWTRALEWDIEKNTEHKLGDGDFVVAYYRPFFKQNLYFSRALNEMVYLTPKIFPNTSVKNMVICVSGVGASKDFSALMTDCVPDLQVQFNGQAFPLYYYEEQDKQAPTLWDAVGDSDYIRRDGVSDFILDSAKKRYWKSVTKEDIFYYVYGILHSLEYRATFANDLKKTLPRLPLVEDPKDFKAFSKAGRQLAELHVGYEEVPPYKGVKVTGDDGKSYKVEKMRFPSKNEKDSILYNSKITVSNIPAQAYEYVVNGKSAIEWVMERYQVTTHPESGITNDPNDWAAEVGNPRYILDLLLSVINVSVQTVEIVNQLPKLKFE